MGTRDNKITTNTETKSRQKRTRNKRHIKEEDNGSIFDASIVSVLYVRDL